MSLPPFRPHHNICFIFVKTKAGTKIPIEENKGALCGLCLVCRGKMHQGADSNAGTKMLGKPAAVFLLGGRCLVVSIFRNLSLFFFGLSISAVF